MAVSPVLEADERMDEVNEHLRLIQKKNSLGFGTDAFLLSAFCREGKNAVELGCGSGIVSLLLLRRGVFEHITAVEKEETLARLAEKNVMLNGLSDAMTVKEGDIRALSSADMGGEVEAVFANPPYMKENCGFSSPHLPKQVSRHETAGGMEEFAAAAARLLKFGGLFYTVYRPDRLSTLFSALEHHGMAPKRMVFVHDSEGKDAAMVLTEAKKGAAEGLTLLPPLFLHEKDGEGSVRKDLSPRAARIYETGRF